MLRATLLIGAMAGPLWAEGLCDADPADVIGRLAGDWQRDGAMSITNEVSDLLRPSEDFRIRLAEGMILSPFLVGLTGAPLELTPVTGYDVDAVDDLLETTDRADLADKLSDTLCGPSALPQFQAVLDVAADISVSGTVTLIAYFEDRILQVSELQLKSDEAILFMTETVLLTPAQAQ